MSSLVRVSRAPARTAVAGLWFGIAVVGQTAMLQLIDAGREVRYQHFAFVTRRLTTADLIPLAIVGAQTLVVAVELWRRREALRTALAASFRPWQLAAIGGIFLLGSATLSRRMELYFTELLVAALVQLVNLATVALCVWALPAQAVHEVEHALDARSARRSPRISDRAVWVAALLTMVAAAVLSLAVYEAHPHIPDEVPYLYHARYLAAGMLTMPAPPVPEAFELNLMTYEPDRWYSPVPPGWPLVLAVGVRFGVPWLVNPLLGGVNILLLYAVVAHVAGGTLARRAAFLLAVSPWHLFMSMNFMTHTATLTCALIATLGILKAQEQERTIWAGLSGAAAGFASLIRPLDGLATVLVLGLYALGVGGRRLAPRGLAAFMFGAVAIGAAILPYNKLLTGSVTTFPLIAYTDRHYGPNTNALGFGPERGLGWPGLDPFPGHGPVDVVVNANINISLINVELFGFGYGSLLLLAVAAVCGTRMRGVRLMVGTIAIVAGLHSFYWFSGGPDFGARYWYLVIAPAVVLTALGTELLQQRFEGVNSADGSGRVLAFVAASCAIALLTFVPWRAMDKYGAYRGMRGDIPRLARHYGFGRSVVLVAGRRHPDYASAAVYNPLDLRGSNEPIYVWDRSPDTRRAVLSYYRDRPVWRVDGPSLTGSSFRVMEGPIAASQLLSRGAY